MGIFTKKKKEVEKVEETLSIPNAGGVIVSNSILEGKASLRWFFRTESNRSQGWVAFGSSDTEEYLDDASNLSVIDYNNLIKIEPAVYGVYHMPVGTNLVLMNGSDGNYFVNEDTDEIIKDVYESPITEAMKANLAFLSQEEHDQTYYDFAFKDTEYITTVKACNLEFNSGEFFVGDPLSYLSKEDEHLCFKDKLPKGNHQIVLSIVDTELTGKRVNAVKIVIRNNKDLTYQCLNGEQALPLFGVEEGIALLGDTSAVDRYREFIKEWKEKHEDADEYKNLFEDEFYKSARENPNVQTSSGDFFLFDRLKENASVFIFRTGLGDGVYSSFGGYTADGELCEIVIPFMNTTYFVEKDQEIKLAKSRLR